MKKLQVGYFDHSGSFNIKNIKMTNCIVISAKSRHRMGNLYWNLEAGD